ncbi:CotH kinase family protein [Spirochaeta dissipatitropha]
MSSKEKKKARPKKKALPPVLRICIAAAAFLAVTAIAYSFLYRVENHARIHDPGLETALRRAIGKVDGRIPMSALRELTYLDAANSNIQHIEQIDLLVNLRILDLSGNPVDDLSPLTSLSRLEELSLQNMEQLQLEDNSLLDNLPPQLTSLDLSHNPELGSLNDFSYMQRLRELHLRNTGISTLDYLSELQGLRILDLRETRLHNSSLEPLAAMRSLEYLNLRNSGIKDITVLSRLRTLRYLNLHSNSGISSLDPLQQLTRLETLILRNVPLGDQIHVLSGMESLMRLNIRNTGVHDLRVLAELMRRGALQDEINNGRTASVDIRDNPVQSDASRGPYGYDLLLPYWNRIGERYPERLPRSASGRLLINEVMASNRDVAIDGDFYDWIEIHNPGTEAVYVGGFFLSSSQDQSFPWRFPEGTEILPGAYLLIAASGRETSEATVPGVIHADFRLSPRGSELSLYADDRRELLDFVQVPEIPRNTSYGRNSDIPEDQNDPDDPEHSWIIFRESSPGTDNSLGKAYHPVHFSHESAFFDDDFLLKLSSGPGVDIFFTLDGSEPDPVNPQRSYRIMNYETGRLETRSSITYSYNEALQISPDPGFNKPGLPAAVSDIQTGVPRADFWFWIKPPDNLPRATVVRALAWDGEAAGSVYSAVFIPGTADDYPLGIMTIAADPRDLFDYEDGMYVPGKIYDDNISFQENWMRHPANYHQRIEAPIHLAFFEPDGFPAVESDAGMRIHGGWSRSHPMKSLRLYARKDYDIDRFFDYPFFSDTAVNQEHQLVSDYKRLMLRSGQSMFRSHLQDAVIQAHLRPHLAVDLLDYRPVIHFINGEYWGIKNLRERFDQYYIAARYNVDPENVIILEGPMGYESQLQAGMPGDHLDYREILDFVVRRDMTQTRNYEHILSRIHIDSFIDYNISRIFSGDPDGVTKHVAMWRLREQTEAADRAGLDTRWRWHSWDYDNALMFVRNDMMTYYANDRHQQDYVDEYYRQQYGSEEVDSELLGDEAARKPAAVMTVRHPDYTALMTGLLQNDSFRFRFLNRFADLLNTVFLPEQMSEAIQHAASLIDEEMNRHIQRWGYPASHNAWQNHVAANLDFVRDRPDIQRSHILDYFRSRFGNPSSMYTLEIEIPVYGGHIRVHSIDLEPSLPGFPENSKDHIWSGSYFAGIPLEITAVPDDNYEFSSWRGRLDSNQRNEPRITLQVSRDIRLSPVFRQETTVLN